MVECPYCGETKKANGSLFSGWAGVRTHTASCSKNTHEYVITNTFGPVHFTEIVNNDITYLQNKYGIIGLRNINNTFKDYGIIKHNIYSKYSKEDCLKGLKVFIAENNKIPIANDFRRTEGRYPSLSVITRLFGTWNNFLREAGVDINRESSERFLDCSEEGIISAIQTFFNTHNRIPSYKDFCNSEGKYPSSGTVERIFGSWNKAIEASGFEPKQNSYGTITVGLDGIKYKSSAEAYFADRYLYNKYEYVVEPKYPEPYNRYYDWWVPSLDLYIELDGGIRPKVVLEKIKINKELNRNCIVVPVSTIYNKTNLQYFVKR